MNWRTETEARLKSVRRRFSTAPLRRLARLRSEVARWGLLALLMGSALWFGAQHTAPLLLAGCGAAASVLLIGGSLYRVPRLVWWVAALGLFTALQLVPLPVEVVEILSPSAADVWRDAFLAFREAPRRFIPLSVDPAATALEFFKFAGLACVLTSAIVIRTKYGTSFLAMAVFLSATATAATTLIHSAMGMTRVYGLFDPGFKIGAWSLGPLLNAGHLAAYASLGWFAGLGLLIGGRGPLPVSCLVPGCAVLASAVVLSQSRAGMLVFAAGTLTLGFKRLRQQRTPVETLGIATLLGVALVTLLAVLLGWTRLFHPPAGLDVQERIELWRSSLHLVGDFPLFGVGKGAYETAFQPYARVEQESNTVFNHPENLAINWLAEWGLLAGSLAIVALCVLLSRLVRGLKRDDWTATGLLVGLSGLSVHNLVDFSLEIFAVGAAAAVIIAALLEPAELVRPPRVGVPLGLVAVMGVAAAVALLMRAAPSQVERRDLARAYRSLPRGTQQVPEGLTRELRASMGRHPGDAYFPLLGGLLARRRGEDPLPFLSRALERSPRNGSVHLALAAAIAERGGRSQALMHLRLAATYEKPLRKQALARAASWGRRATIVAAAFPEHQPGAGLLTDVCTLLDDVERVDCLRVVENRAGQAAEVRWPLANALLGLAEARRGRCAVLESCRKEILALLEQSGARYGWQADYLRARVMALDAGPSAAAEALLSGCPARAEAAQCAEAAVRHAERANDIDLMVRSVERYVRVSCPGSTCATVHDAAAALFERSGAAAKVLEHRRAAVDEAPTAARWLAVSDAALELGSTSTAAVALERALASPAITGSERSQAATLSRRLGFDERAFELSVSGER